MKKLIVICGPTATGKTALGVQVAKKLDGEILSVDSMQIYRGMDIGTAKVTEEEKSGIPHYMIDVVDPKERFTVSDYAKKALIIVEDIFFRGKTPILVGGTGMYINSILFELSFSTYDEDIRNQVLQMSETKSKEEMWQYLYYLDKDRAEQLAVNDLHRVTRAIEIALNGKPEKVDEFEKMRYDADIYVLSGDRSEIYDRINKRVDIMMQNGLLDEVRKLMDDGLTNEHQSFGAIAYKEIYDYMHGVYDKDKVIDLIKQRSRNYAKRQLTWCRKYYPNAVWLNYKDVDNNLNTIVEKYKNG